MNTVIKTVEVIGTFAFALSGIIEARKKGMDIVGVYAVAMITASAGTLRDFILDRHPLFNGSSITGIRHLSGALLLGAFITKRVTEHGSACPWCSCSTRSGSACSAQRAPRSPIRRGFTVHRGAFGRHDRCLRRRDADMICNEIPAVFQRTELYATCAFAGPGVTWP
jgi:uncharacterized membrane protein YeiH